MGGKGSKCLFYFLYLLGATLGKLCATIALEQKIKMMQTHNRVGFCVCTVSLR